MFVAELTQFLVSGLVRDYILAYILELFFQIFKEHSQTFDDFFSRFSDFGFLIFHLLCLE